MLGNSPVKVVYNQQPIPGRKKLYRSPLYVTPRINQVSPRSVFKCIDEIYSTGLVSYPVLQQRYVPLHLSSQVSKDDRSTITQKHRKWLLTIIIIIIIGCIIAIIVLLAVFLSL
jgi:hypothetical protein